MKRMVSHDLVTNVPPNMKITKSLILVILLSAASIPSLFAQTASPQPKQEKLLNGLKILMWPDPAAPLTSVRIRIHSGSSFDPQGKEGVMRLLAENIFPEQEARDFFTEDLGGSLEILTNYDYIEIQASSKPENFLTMLETLASAVANPTIDKATTDKLQAKLLIEVKGVESDTAYVADQAVANRLFGTFPYGRPQFGTSASIAKVDFADLIEAKQRFLTADNATVAVTGNFDRNLGFRAIRRYFGAWLKSDKRVPSAFRQPDEPPAGMLTVPSPNKGTAAIRFAMRGAARNGKDLAAASVFSNVLEARLRARVPAAHATDVKVSSRAHILPGVIVIGFVAARSDIQPENGKIEAADLIAAAMAEPLTDAEFQDAKRRFQAEWAKKDVYSFWLDADTYKIARPEADARIADNVTLVDVKAFAERARKLAMVTVLVNTPPAPAN